MPVQFVARVDIGDVDFERRSLERLDGVENGDRGEGIAGRIDDDGVGGLPRITRFVVLSFSRFVEPCLPVTIQPQARRVLSCAQFKTRFDNEREETPWKSDISPCRLIRRSAG